MPTNPVSHPSPETLQSFGLGKLDEFMATEVRRHLESCPECRRKLPASPNPRLGDALHKVGATAATLPPSDRTNNPAPARTDTYEPWPSTMNPEAAALALGGQASPFAVNPLPAIPDLPPELANNSQYQVLSELGRGGMGVVYLARNVLMDRLEVLKVVRQALLNRPGTAERFLREIRSAAKLSHGNVVKAYSALALGGLLVFAMEYVEGEDLARVVEQQGRLPVTNACLYAYQTALGLQHAHEQGLVHRDIKPHNLILFRQGKKHIVKVFDFGLAKATREGELESALTGMGMMMGTPDYVAPEQARDAASADIRADIYSLGCTLYFLLTGAPPFTGKSIYEIMQAHMTLAAKPLTDVRNEVSMKLAAVVAKMMVKDPAGRYQKPAEVGHALLPFVKPAAAAVKPLVKKPPVPPAPRSLPVKPVILNAETADEVGEIIKEGDGRFGSVPVSDVGKNKWECKSPFEVPPSPERLEVVTPVLPSRGPRSADEDEPEPPPLVRMSSINRTLVRVVSILGACLVLCALVCAGVVFWGRPQVRPIRQVVLRQPEKQPENPPEKPPAKVANSKDAEIPSPKLPKLPAIKDFDDALQKLRAPDKLMQLRALEYLSKQKPPADAEKKKVILAAVDALANGDDPFVKASAALVKVCWGVYD